jgi:hypothetical protein
MRMKGKKPIFSYKDTFDLDATLSPIIYAGLVKFREVITSSDHEFARGVPGKVISEYYPDYDGTGELPEGSFEKWVEIIDKMIFAFDESRVPDISEYNLLYECFDDDIDEGNEDRHKKYDSDIREWRSKVLKGNHLFAEYRDCLWW